jgi:hypothetical protein
MARDIVWIGILMGCLIGGGIFAYRNGNRHADHGLYHPNFAQMGNALATRSDLFMLFQIGLFSNKAMILAVLSPILLQLAVNLRSVPAKCLWNRPASIGESPCASVSARPVLSVNSSNWSVANWVSKFIIL